MARKKRTSQVLEAAHQRLAGLNSITPPPDFGSNLTLAAYTWAIIRGSLLNGLECVRTGNGNVPLIINS